MSFPSNSPKGVPMRAAIPFALLSSVASQATELIVFEANKPAIARDVNDNFSRLDSAIQNRATKSSLDATDGALKSVLSTVGQIQTGKASQVDVDKALAAKADTASLADLGRKHKTDVDALNASLKGTLTAGNLAGIRDSLKLKADSAGFNAFKRQTETNLAGKQATLGFSPLNAAGGTVSGDLSVSKSLTVGGGISAGGFKTGGEANALRGRFDTVIVPAGRIQNYTDADHGAIYGDKAGTPGSGNYSLAWKRDGSASYLRAASTYLALRAGEAAPTYGDGTVERTLWHSGNLDAAAFVKTKGAILEGNESNEITSVYNDNYTLDKAIGGLASIRHALDFRWYDSHWQIGNIRSGSTPSLGFGITNGNADIRVWVGDAETRIFGNLILPTGKLSAASASMGDLRLTGSLVAAPGATPADYVFEPDYKLAPLAEVEAFTKANKHLPEVPSAGEMTENGVDLAKMNMVLLKKVEELTLHAIAQEKRLDQQEQVIQRLLSERADR